MKKVGLILMGLVLAVASGSAQNVDVRAYGGINILSLTSDAESITIDDVIHSRVTQGRVGYQFGAAATIGSRFYIQPGVQYSVLSTEIVTESTAETADFTDQASIQVISVPLKVGLRIINPEDEDWINVRIFGGIDGHHITAINHSEQSGTIDDGLSTDDYNNLIVNADFGAGIDILFLFLDVGYQLGLTPVHPGGDDAKANSFYTNLGIRIKF
jgi:hypothetical protein